PCFSKTPNGRMQTPPDFSAARTKSAEVSSSSLTGSSFVKGCWACPIDTARKKIRKAAGMIFLFMTLNILKLMLFNFLN
ncbi:MAG: hypothetical protein K0B09_12025, partial [Bacteroidales bacterium]|nr:hypothetical protein [Bacteroidales bacterium]